MQKLALSPQTSLILVCAPAGYGKTTLLASWIGQMRQSGTAVAWYALDAEDNNPSAFGAYLLASFEHILSSDYEVQQLLRLLRASPEFELQHILPALINAIDADGREIVLVLDDYHLIRTPAIHQAIEFLLGHCPQNFHLVIGSRSNPPLSLARLRARGRLIELRAADLRFTDEETRRFLCESMQLDMDVALSSRLSSQVEGWAAGLQLAALSLADHPEPEERIAAFTGSHKQLSEYLLEEVLNQLPEEVQSFLLYTSILERMSASLCDAILGINHSATLLQQIETANLFVIALDDEATWYRYHHLFRGFLFAWFMRTQPGRIAALHKAASAWLAEHGLLREAAHHAFRCGDWSFAADFVEQHSFTLIIQSEIATIYEWCAVFPESVMRNRPRLCCFQGLALAYQFRARNRAQVEARLQQAEQKLATLQDLDQAQEVGELAGVVRTFLAMAPDPRLDAHTYLQLVETRLAAYPADDPGRFPWLLIAGYAYLALHQPAEAADALERALPLALRSGLLFGAIETTFHLAHLAYSQGTLSQSLALCRSAQEDLAALGHSNPALPALGCLEIAAGRVLIEQNELEAAEQHLRLGFERMGWGMNPYYLMTGYLAQFQLYTAQGRSAQAMACLDQLEALWPDIRFCTQGLRAQAGLRFHPNEAAARAIAQDWLCCYPAPGEHMPSPAGLGPLGAAEVFYQANLIWTRIQIALGNAQAVWPYLNRQLALACETGLRGREIELRLLAAQAHFVERQADQALAELNSALTLAYPAGYLCVFDQSAALDELCHLAARRGLHPAYMQQILATIRSHSFRVAHPRYASDALSGLIEPLSSREKDVLRLIAAGASNQEIARQFVISIGTVKSHVNHILGKLAARNRTEAVMKARQQGLLDEGT